jgi:hypothetical protein
MPCGNPVPRPSGYPDRTATNTVAHCYRALTMQLNHHENRDLLADRLKNRRRTVWDARHLLASQVGRPTQIRIVDAQYGAATMHGTFLNVMHHPETGFSLLFRGLSPYSERQQRNGAPGRYRRVSLPLSMIIDMPTAFRFLREPSAAWPVPSPIVRCPADGCRHAGNTGRFCTRCGIMVRRGRWLGDGFAVHQQALREMADSAGAGDPCGCGAVFGRNDTFCAKCGTRRPGCPS